MSDVTQEEQYYITRFAFKQAQSEGYADLARP